MSNKSLTIIIPISKKEDKHIFLLKQLKKFLPPHKIKYEIIISTANNNNFKKLIKKNNIITIRCHQENRPIQFNTAVNIAQGEWLWFLHADSIINKNLVNQVILTIKDNNNKIYFAKLSFQKNSIKDYLLYLNQLCANVRSSLFGYPYGDQSFLLKKSLFENLGSFPLSTPEDLKFICVAKKKKIKMEALKAYIKTSPRKYNNKWLITTISHILIFFKTIKGKQ